jgi:hypothetical protein
MAEFPQLALWNANTVSARLSAHPNDLTVNLIELPDNKTPAK